MIISLIIVAPRLPFTDLCFYYQTKVPENIGAKQSDKKKPLGMLSNQLNLFFVNELHQKKENYFFYFLNDLEFLDSK